MQNVRSPRSAAALVRDGNGDNAAARPPRHAPVASRPRPAPGTARLPDLWHVAAEYLLLLPVGAAVALVWANTRPESYFLTALRLEFLVNDVAMVLFFGLIMKEVAEATVSGGVLHPWRRAALPLIASLGLTLVPAMVFATVVPWLDEPRVIEGWPVVLVTDVAFGYLVARALFGRHPAIPWFVLLGICANALAIVALAFAGGAERLRLDILVALMTAALGAAFAMRRARIRSFWPYILGAGGLSWSALYFGGFEPALALVPVVPFLPHGPRDPGFFVDAAPGARDTLSRFECWCRHPAQLALLLFGLVNAGVPLQALNWGTLGLPLVLLLVKPVGLMLGVGLGAALGLHLPPRIGIRELVVVGFIASVGFTGALFFATASVGPGPTLSALKMGALVSVGGVAAAALAAAVLKTGRFGEGRRDVRARPA